MIGCIQIPIQTIRFSKQYNIKEMLNKITQKFIIHLLPLESSKLEIELKNGITLAIELDTATITVFDTGARETESIVEIHKLLTHFAQSIRDERMMIETYHSFEKKSL